MSTKPNRPRAFSIYLTVLIVLLILACMLFIAASTANAKVQPRVRPNGLLALALSMPHG